MLTENSCIASASFKSTFSISDNSLVSIIVLNYNGKDVLRDCLESISKSTYSPFEVLVVDNASKDGSDQIMLPDKRYRLLKNKHNLGFCGGNNVGIRAANGEFVVLLNNDTLVHPDWLSEFVKAAKNGADFCAPKILLADKKTINSAGLEIHIAGFGLLRGSGELDKGQYDNLIEIGGVHGACIFATRKAIEEVGLLDEIFYAFNDDTDWSWRALLKNLHIVYVPSALVIHKWGHKWNSKALEKFRHVERNRLILILTNYSRRSLILLLPIFFATEMATLLYCLNNHLLSAKINSYTDLILKRKYLKQRRRIVQKTRRITDRLLSRKLTDKFAHSLIAKPVEPLNTLYSFFWAKISQYI